jgi:hypothetical protein
VKIAIAMLLSTLRLVAPSLRSSYHWCGQSQDLFSSFQRFLFLCSGLACFSSFVGSPLPLCLDLNDFGLYVLIFCLLDIFFALIVSLVEKNVLD